jgi:7,8-dihydropterin-6-yl-methyl-4-(beta-D-ribofuranosyl)aminobenzene 5'-phosphate synthase
MPYRISPLWWPLIGLSSPVLVPMLFFRNRRYKQNVEKSQKANNARIENAKPLELPELEHFELTVLLEQKAAPGFLGAPGVSYLIKTDQGSLLFDLGYGPEKPALAHNAKKMAFNIDQAGALAISHLHPDHMGGFKAVRKNQVTMPPEFGRGDGIPCFVPAEARADGFETEVVEGPRMIAAGIASTGPLSRSLFLMGWTEEQAIVARLKHKGLIVLTGCGHPTIETILQMVQRLSDEPIYAIGGGLHFPITDSPLRKPGLKVQMIWGTGKPPWKRITKANLDRTIENLNAVNPRHVFLSAHDTCDYAIDRIRNALECETTVLRSGATYQL